MSQGRVYIVDDDAFMRQWICELVGSVDIEGEAFETVDAFLKAYGEDRATAVVMDVRLPDVGGLAIQESLLARGATAPVIFVTGYGDVWTAVQAMKRGAFDFLEKPVKDQELLSRVQAAIKHHATKLEAKKSRDGLDDQLRLLSPREMEILMRLATGKANKTVADELDVSTRTVESHRAKLMNKLQATSREAITDVALQLLLTQLRPGVPS